MTRHEFVITISILLFLHPLRVDLQRRDNELNWLIRFNVRICPYSTVAQKEHVTIR